jgi:hypothetical protein
LCSETRPNAKPETVSTHPKNRHDRQQTNRNEGRKCQRFTKLKEVFCQRTCRHKNTTLLGYDCSVKTRRPNFTANNDAVMAKKTTPPEKTIEDFETLQLKKRIAELEAQLKDAEMKAIAFSTMVDIAEREFNIPIRKKYNTKPSKK